MERHVTMEEISDGKLYDKNDMVKVHCNGCQGCFSCCLDMGQSIILDPLDGHRLSTGLGIPFVQLMNQYLEWNVDRGIILPNIRMTGQDLRCPFLNGAGRCQVHAYRPGVCRLFPLGRFYENRGFRYFLQTNQCNMDHPSKVKVKKWLDLPNLSAYERYISDWHYLLCDWQKLFQEQENQPLMKQINLYVMQEFFVRPYGQEQDFYMEFYERYNRARTQWPVTGKGE